jgi:Na+/proline symporter
MANKKSDNGEQNFPLMAGVMAGLLGGLIVGASFWIINYWPLPPSVAPYFGFKEGFLWGGVIGFSFGSIIGFLTDDKHFEMPEVTAANLAAATKAER